MYEQRILNNRKKRNRELRNHIITAILTLLLIISLTLTLGSFLSKASGKNDNTDYKYYTCIVIEKGATLYTIAAQYMGNHYSGADDYTKEVMSINNLESDQIIAGQSLIIPYYSAQLVF